MPQTHTSERNATCRRVLEKEMWGNTCMTGHTSKLSTIARTETNGRKSRTRNCPYGGGWLSNLHPNGDARVQESAGRQKCLTCGLPWVSRVISRRTEAARIAAIAMHASHRSSGRMTRRITREGKKVRPTNEHTNNKQTNTNSRGKGADAARDGGERGRGDGGKQVPS